MGEEAASWVSLFLLYKVGKYLGPVSGFSGSNAG